MTVRTFIVVSLATMALTATAGASGDKSFKDWYAACDNLRNCSAYGFDPATNSGYLRVERGGAADAPTRITISVDLADAADYTLAFDPALPGLPDRALTGEEGEGNEYRRSLIAEGPAAKTLIESLRKAHAIIVTRRPAQGKQLDTPVSKISMSGAVAALLWIDDQQKRVDTVTALIKPGPKPASAIPAQPSAPVIVAAKPTQEKAPAKQPAALTAKGRALCGESDPKSKLEDSYPLGGGIVLYEFSCPENSGAYNFQSVYMMGPAGNVQAIKPVSFNWPIKMDGQQNDGTRDGLLNAVFDPAKMTLTSFNKGRGIGDCGSEEEWVFDGKTFRLGQLRFMSECNGVALDDWPVLYRTDVKR